MKKSIFVLPVLILGFYACQSPKETAPKTFSLNLVDSIFVEQLEPRYLIGYEPVDGKYLLSNNSFFDYLELDKDGQVLSEGKFPFEGPDAVEMIFGLGYFRRDLAIATLTDGFIFYKDEVKSGGLKIPYAYGSFVFLPQLSLIDWNGGILYPKFMADSAMGLPENELYGAMYSSPLLEFQKEGEPLKAVVVLPEDSPYRNGNFHGDLILVPYLHKKDLYMLTWNRPEILHYQSEKEDFVYQKTAKLDLKDWVSYTEVPMANAESFYDSYRKKVPGMITQIFKFGDYFLVNYQHGVGEDVLMNLMGENGRPDPQKVYQVNPPLLAVLDKELNLLADGLKFPKGAHGSLFVNTAGEIVIGKNPFFSDVEDPGLILYRLKLSEE